MTVSDVDLFELNEAFAAVGLASMRDLGITDDIVNVNGGAIALGHPVGMSGTRVVLTLLNELRRRGGGARRRRPLRRRRPGRRRDRPHAVAGRALVPVARPHRCAMPVLRDDPGHDRPRPR